MIVINLKGFDRKKLEAMKLSQLIELMKTNNLPPVTSPSCIDAILTAIETRFRQVTRSTMSEVSVPKKVAHSQPFAAKAYTVASVQL